MQCAHGLNHKGPHVQRIAPVGLFSQRIWRWMQQQLCTRTHARARTLPPPPPPPPLPEHARTDAHARTQEHACAPEQATHHIPIEMNSTMVSPPTSSFPPFSSGCDTVVTISSGWRELCAASTSAGRMCVMRMWLRSVVCDPSKTNL